MKKVFLLLFAVALCTGVVQARIFGVGVKAGLEMPKASVSGMPDGFSTSLQFDGFHAGLFAELNIPVIGIGVQPEVLYVNKSMSVLDMTPALISSASGTPPATITKRGSFLEVPLNITWGLTLPGVRPFVLVAPTFAYSLSKIEMVEGTSVMLGNKTWSLGLGLGLEVWKIQIMAKYKFGLTNLAADLPESSPYKGSTYKDNGWSISLGYVF
jgi:hypothetical protein